ncbi:MAG: MFS transporter [Nitratireductor sp.]|nr:MFS transporter [Nitratireductor sp.]
MPQGETAYPQTRWRALAVLLIASFMNMIDVTIVNVALPSLQRNLGATSSGIEWVVAAYIMAFALGLLPFGRLGDTFGHRRIFLWGVAAFTIASTFCGMATSIEVLIAARVLQGVAGAMMTPQTLAIAQVIFPPRERGSAFALFGLSAGLAAVTGPIAGGLLVDANLFGMEWRPIFLVNIPVGILAIFAGLRYLPPLPGERALGIDLGGIFLAGITMVLAVFPLVEGREAGWPAWCFWMLAASIPAAIAFVFWQRRQNSHDRPQLFPVVLLSNGQFMLGTLVSTAFFSAVPSFFFVLAMFLQIGFGLSPIESGLTTVPFSVGVLVSSLVSGRFAGRYSRERMIAGAVMLVCAMLALRWLITTIGDSIDHWLFLPPLLLGGLGLGTTISPLFQTVLSTVPGRDAGSASGGLQAFQQVGGAIGVATVGQMFFARLAEGMAAGGNPHPAFIAALEWSLVYTISAFSVVIVAALFLKRPQGHGGPSARPEPAPVAD